VVTPAGRIVVGEFFLDPDYVSPARLDALARAAGLVLRERRGTHLAYLARLEAA
jgi:hypothetical protein